MTTKRADLEAMTKAEIVAMYGLDVDPNRTTKDELIGRAMAETPKPAAKADGFDAEALMVLLDECTITFTDAAGLVHTVNPGKEHTLAWAGFPESTKNYPAEWADFGGDTITATLDGESVGAWRFIHAFEKKEL